MNVGKRTKSVLAILLICGLLLLSVHNRAIAAVPVALGPAIKYAVGAALAAGGLYAADKESLDYVINDYWNKVSNHIKSQWANAVLYGTGVGILYLNDPLKSSIKSYLDANYQSGENVVKLRPSELYTAEVGVWYDLEDFYVIGQGMSVGPTVLEPYGNGQWIWKKDVLVGNTVIYTLTAVGPVQNMRLNWIRVVRVETGLGKYLLLNVSYYMSPTNTDSRDNIEIYYGDLARTLGVTVEQLLYQWGETTTLELVGDAVGFGNALEDRPDIKIPCPPVPAEEWPDSWIDQLEEELNRIGNPTLDDEKLIEEWEDEYDWYLDEYGNIYKVKKGEPPRKPNDEPLRIPGPPLPDPDYPTEDDPEITIEHHPPQTEIIEHPDGSRTEKTIQITTIIKRWWDPEAKRWRTTIEEETTTTTVDYDPEGNEIGRTTTTITQPKGEREETEKPDDTAINWEPLRRGLYELTEKFPFCLPWDLKRGIEKLEANEWDRKIEIDVGDGIWPEMVIDLTMFDEIARITRVVLLVVFDLGLIFATRRLMGGDV